jgi:hypothetical protein
VSVKKQFRRGLVDEKETLGPPKCVNAVRNICLIYAKTPYVCRTCGCYWLISGTNSQNLSHGFVFVQKQSERGRDDEKERLRPAKRIEEVRESSVV